MRLPVIWSPDEIARLIDAAPTPFYRALLMTLYATGMRRAGGGCPQTYRHRFGTHGDPRSGGKGRKDRDIVLSPHLHQELRQHYRRLRRRPTVWLFPGGTYHTADTPITEKVVWHA